MKIFYGYKKHSLPLPPAELEKMAADLLNAAREAGAPILDMELHLVSDACIAGLNSRMMNRAGPTNVLSFPGGLDMPGVLVLSLDTLKRESRLYGQDMAEYLLSLLAHGAAHLAGFEHGDEMEEFAAGLKSAYFARIGITAV